MKKIIALLLTAASASAETEGAVTSSQGSQVIIAIILGLLVGALIALYFLNPLKKT